jgi:acyl-lipid omega-6 desaturase (Delta-12 desaturase)
MSIIQSCDLLDQVKKIKSSDARGIVPKNCYTRSYAKTFLWLGLDLLFFMLGMFLVFSNPYAGFKLLGGVILGVATAMLFVWAHDAAHGTLFKNKQVAELLGTLAMLPSLNIYRMWAYGHNRVHHGFTSFSPMDWIWRPFTAKQYQNLSSFQKLLYRIERSFFTCAFHYLRRVWWAEMLSFNPGKDKKQQRYYRDGKHFVAIYAVIMSVGAYIFAGGLIGIIAGVILPFIVFNYFISMIVYLHHTHPDIPFFDVKSEWSQVVGALYCSTIIKCSKPAQILLHHIMTHIPHHLDVRIPFYHLPEAYEALKKEYGQYIHEYEFKWSYVLNIFKQCKIYDFENKIWMNFEEAESY